MHVFDYSVRKLKTFIKNCEGLVVILFADFHAFFDVQQGLEGP